MRATALLLALPGLGACVTPGGDVAVEAAARTDEAPTLEPPASGGQDAEEDAPETWAPRIPTETTKDWIMLKSGEWLRGDLEVLRDNRLEFDSDELDDQVFDWEDVYELRSPRPHQVLLETGQLFVGSVVIDREEGVVATATGVHRFSRPELVAIVSGRPTRRNLWSGELSFGLAARSGNTDRSDTTASLRARRRTPKSRVELGYDLEIGESDGSQDVNNQRGTVRVNRFLGRYLFLTPFFGEFYKDPFQNVSGRYTAAVGAGYHIWLEPSREWRVEVDVGGQYEKFDSVEAGEDDDATSGIVIGITTLDLELSSAVDLEAAYRVDSTAGDKTSTNQRLVLELSVDLIGDTIDLDVTFEWDRVGDPESDEDGDTPDKNDFRTTVGLTWEF